MSEAILVIEDNPTLRKMERVALESEGYEVLEAANGAHALSLAVEERPLLVIQDLGLPDVDGVELGDQLATVLGADATIVAVSGMARKLDDARHSGVPYGEYLLKPVDAHTLLALAESALGHAGEARPYRPMRGRVIVADDDEVQRKLLAVRLERMGFDVEPVADGRQALEAARRGGADAIISDVLMPVLDGFMLCHEARRDPALARVPIILASNAYIGDRDRDLAVKTGATAFVARTPRLDGVIDVLLRHVGTTPLAPETQPDIEREHAERVADQLERQVAENRRLRRERERRSTQISVLSGLSTTLNRAPEPGAALREVLERALEVVDVQAMGLYLCEDGIPHLRARAGESAGVFDAGSSARALTHAVVNAIARGSNSLVPVGELDGAEASGAFAVLPFRAGTELAGALVMNRRAEEFTDDELGFLRTLVTQVADAVGLAEAIERLAGARDETIARLAKASEYRDDDTGVHNERMSRYAEVVGHDLGLSSVELYNLRRAAMLHDVGKIAIPDAILLKPGKLTDEEFERMKLHTIYGAEILGGSEDPVLALAAEIAMTHHERVDGGGYPHGLAGDRIPQAGRIAAIADVFDALTSDRVYRPAFEVSDALEVVMAGRGTQFDPDVFDAFERSLDEILAIRDELNPRQGSDPPSASDSRGLAPNVGRPDRVTR